MGSTPINPGTAPPGQPGPMQPGEFQNISQRPLVTFATVGIQPQAALYVTTDDKLELAVWWNTPPTNLWISYRLLRPDGSITVMSQYAQGAQHMYFDLMEGFLLSVFVCSDGVQRGNSFARVGLARVASATAYYSTFLLTAGYVGAINGITWPGTMPENSTDGQGLLRAVPIANPGAGAELIITVPDGRRWRVQSLKVNFTTSAVAVNRHPRIIIDDGANIVWGLSHNQNQSASLTWTWCWAPGYANNTINDTYVTLYLPTGLKLAGGHRLRTLTVNLDAGDQYSSICALVEEWIDG